MAIKSRENFNRLYVCVLKWKLSTILGIIHFDHLCIKNPTRWWRVICTNISLILRQFSTFVKTLSNLTWILYVAESNFHIFCVSANANSRSLLILLMKSGIICCNPGPDPLRTRKLSIITARYGYHCLLLTETKAPLDKEILAYHAC